MRAYRVSDNKNHSLEAYNQTIPVKKRFVKNFFYTKNYTIKDLRPCGILIQEFLNIVKLYGVTITNQIVEEVTEAITKMQVHECTVDEIMQETITKTNEWCEEWGFENRHGIHSSKVFSKEQKKILREQNYVAMPHYPFEICVLKNKVHRHEVNFSQSEEKKMAYDDVFTPFGVMFCHRQSALFRMGITVKWQQMIELGIQIEKEFTHPTIHQL